MAQTFKYLKPSDVAQEATYVYEYVPMTGTLFSGTYGAFMSETNVLTYSHGMFESVYDYPYLSSSANKLMDISMGYAASSALSASANYLNAKKIQMYNVHAQRLMGFDATGSIQLFDADGNLSGGTKLKECIFMDISRAMAKDGIKKGSISLTYLNAGTAAAPTTQATMTDAHAPTDYFTNSPVGDWATLKNGSTVEGLVFYQAGVIVLTASIFAGATTVVTSGSTNVAINPALTGTAITGTADALRRRIVNLQFSNTTELNSTSYFIKLGHNEFNYSSNPTYLTGSKIRIKNTAGEQPVSYITTVGLYSADNELLAVAKLSQPIKKTPGNSPTLKVRLDH